MPRRPITSRSRCSGPVGDTRNPDSEWHAVACDIRDRIFPVKEGPGYSKQCDSCHGWPFLETEPQTTDLIISARSSHQRAFRAHVLEQYWECSHCLAGQPVAKCDWCHERFPEQDTCNFKAHDDTESWQDDLGEREGDERVAESGLRGVKHLSLGCKTRWTNILKADKIIQANCPACGVSIDIDREGDYMEFVTKHKKECEGMPSQWLHVAANPIILAQFFKEDAVRSGLRLYQHKATDVVMELLQRFNPDQLPDEVNEAALERKRARLSLPAPDDADEGRETRVVAKRLRITFPKPEGEQDEVAGGALGGEKLRLTFPRPDGLPDDVDGTDEVPTRLRLTLPRAATKRKKKVETDSSGEDQDRFMEDGSTYGDDHDDDNPESFDHLGRRSSASPIGQSPEDGVGAGSGGGVSFSLDRETSPSTRSHLGISPLSGKAAQKQMALYQPRPRNTAERRAEAKEKKKLALLVQDLQAQLRCSESDVKHLTQRNAELEAELAHERAEKKKVHDTAGRLRRLAEALMQVQGRQNVAAGKSS